MSHKNIVNMLDLVLGDKHMMVVFEHLDMDLRQFQTQQTKKTKYLPYDMVRVRVEFFFFFRLCSCE
jgi:hypothetical protein